MNIVPGRQDEFLVMCMNGIRHGFFGDAEFYMIAGRQMCECYRTLDRKRLRSAYLTIRQVRSSRSRFCLIGFTTN